MTDALNSLLAFLNDFVALRLALAGVLLAVLVGWVLANMLRDRLLVPDSPVHSWLRSFLLTPVLALVAILVPHLVMSELANIVLLMVLLAPVTTLVWLTYRADHKSGRAAWRDAILITLGYLVSGFILTIGNAEMEAQLAAHLPRLLPALGLGIVLGLGMGYALYRLREWIVSMQAARHARNEYSRILDPFLGGTRSLLEAILTQFHASPLTGVLVILAAVLPFTAFNQDVLLLLFTFVPVVSATLAALLVADPAPNMPGLWHHLRAGLNNVAQIGIGYVTGTVLLVPLLIVHQWVQAEPGQVGAALLTHLDLTFTALFYSLVLGLVGGILTSRVAFLRTLFINLGNIGRTIPSLAVLALALPIFGVGFTPSIIALIFIGTLPILVNTSVGIIGISDDIKEAARGMGMNDLQVLFRVEVPIAIPVIMAGIRTSAVLVVASAVLAGFIGGGGLGALIIRGDGSGRDDILFTGAILATILAIFLEYLFSWLEKLLTPRGLRKH